MSPLACTFLTSKQYTAIQNLFISPALSAVGYNHTWPVALRYGDHKYCGLQLRHLESETLIRKIQQLQLLLMKPDTSKLIFTMLAWYQHVSGLGSPILERYPYNVNYINSYWLNDFVRLLRKYDVKIKLRTTYLQPLQRKKKRFFSNGSHSYQLFLSNNYQETSCMSFISVSYLVIRHYQPKR